MIAILQLLLLVILMVIYLRLADYFNIIDKPNDRSSHSVITVRGGGVIFPIAVLLWFLSNGFNYPWFTLGLILISIISFLDDLYTLPARQRLIVHLLSVGMMLYQLNFSNLDWYWWVVGIILIIGWINAFNFMDGINGITAFYALAVIIPVYLVNTEIGFVNNELLMVTAFSLIIFAWFNARKRAKCFAGDVGSVSMAFIIAFLMTRIIIYTGKWEFILFVSVYGVDTVLTIIYRLIKGENIFKAHRSHLYQYLANEMNWGHVPVSIIYSILQLGISFSVLYFPFGSQSVFYTPLVLGVLVITYVLSKFVINRQIHSHASSN